MRVMRRQGALTPQLRKDERELYGYWVYTAFQRRGTKFTRRFVIRSEQLDRQGRYT